VVTPPAAPPNLDNDVRTEDDFFRYILAKVESSFGRSDIKSRQEQLGEKWYYSVCALPLQRKQNLLLGLKWGADRQTRHAPQRQQPGSAAVAEVSGYPFIRKSLPYLSPHFGALANLNYLNVCPFRAPQLPFLTPRDWQLAIDDFFLETIDYLEPPRTVIIGTTDVKQLEARHLAESKPVRVTNGTESATGYTGVILGRGGARYPFGAVPQPTYALTNATRHMIWEKVFGS
jgi:hypothetical protein